MSSNVFVVADSHFTHRGIVKFLRPDGTKVRPWDTLEEMDEALVQNWNSVVRPQDKVYHLGDVVINRSALPILARLNGTKILIKGNHDVFRLNEYEPYFKDIRGSQGMGDDFILTHIPIHPAEIFPTGRWKGNIHGHLHSESVVMVGYEKVVNYGRDETWSTMEPCVVIDPRYLCVSMEQINYTPMSWEDVKKKWEEQQ